MKTPNPLELQSSLTNFAMHLPEPPKWMGIIDDEGIMLANIGGFDANPHFVPTSLMLGHHLQRLAHHTSLSLFTHMHGEPTLTTHLYATGTLFLVNIRNAFHLALSYHGSDEGCCYTSLEMTQAAIQNHIHVITDALYGTPEDDAPTIQEEKSASTNSLQDILKQVMDNIAGSPLWLVVIDQFGELHGFAGDTPPETDDPTEQNAIIRKVAQHINNTHALFQTQNIRSLSYTVFRTGRGITYVDSLITPQNTFYLIIQFPPLQVSIETIAQSVHRQQDQIIAHLNDVRPA